MAEVTLTINGRNFGVSCDDGQEERVMELGRFIDARFSDIAKAGAATNELHIFLLTALTLADEVYDLRAQAGEIESTVHAIENFHQDEEQIALAIEHLADRIDAVTKRIQKA